MLKNQLLSFSVISILIFFFLLVAFSPASDTLETIQTDTTDSTDNIVATYKNVDILEVTEWCEPEKIENVDVVVRTQNSGPLKIVYTKKDQSKCEITLVEGVTVKIFSHIDKKLLKTYGKI